MTTQHVERVFVAVDIMNLWYSGRDQLGIDVRVNYKKLKSMIANNKLGSHPRALRLVAYVVTSSAKHDSGSGFDLPKNSKFIDSLEDLGYEIKNRNMYREKGLLKPYATDWDIGIAIDAVNHVDEYDTFCLASGDGDYAVLVDHLKERGKYVEVITFESTVSRLLHCSADRVIYLTENEIFRQVGPLPSGTCLTCKQPSYKCKCNNE